MKRIFLSHSSKDGELAKKVCDILEENGDLCWIAPCDIAYGKCWAGEIADTLIENTRLFVFLLSENSNKSKQVIKEINLAITYDIPMLIIKVTEIDLNRSLLYYLSDLHIYDCSLEKGTIIEQMIVDLIRNKEQGKLIKRKSQLIAKTNENIDDVLLRMFHELDQEENNCGENGKLQDNIIPKKLYEIIGRNIVNSWVDNSDEYYNDFEKKLDNGEFSDETENADLQKRYYIGAWLDPLHGFNGADGKFFSLVDKPDTHTVVYMVNTRINPHTSEWWLEPEFLRYVEEVQDDGKVIKTYFAPNASQEGNPCMSFSFIDNKNIVVINTGFIGNKEVIFTKKPTIMNLGESSFQSSGDGQIRRFLSNKERGVCIIDLQCHIPLESQLIYDEVDDEYKLYIDIQARKKYFAFQVSSNPEKLHKASPHKIGYSYYIGLCGLEQNWLKAAEWLLLSDKPEDAYYLGVIFSKDPLLYDEVLAKEYLNKASALGIEMADVLLNELIQN